MMRPKPVEDWRRWHRFWSIRLNIIGTGILSAFMTWPDLALGLWNAMPEEVKQFLPARMVMLLPLVIFIAAMGARLIKQKPHGE